MSGPFDAAYYKDLHRFIKGEIDPISGRKDKKYYKHRLYWGYIRRYSGYIDLWKRLKGGGSPFVPLGIDSRSPLTVIINPEIDDYFRRNDLESSLRIIIEREIITLFRPLIVIAPSSLKSISTSVTTISKRLRDAKSNGKPLSGDELSAILVEIESILPVIEEIDDAIRSERFAVFVDPEHVDAHIYADIKLSLSEFVDVDLFEKRRVPHRKSSAYQDDMMLLDVLSQGRTIGNCYKYFESKSFPEKDETTLRRRRKEANLFQKKIFDKYISKLL